MNDIIPNFLKTKYATTSSTIMTKITIKAITPPDNPPPELRVNEKYCNS